MARHLIAAVLIALSVAPACADPVASTPSAEMAKLAKLKNQRGGIGNLIVKFQIETTDKAAADRCLKILLEHRVTTAGYAITKTSSAPAAVYTLEGTKEYLEPSDAADKLLAQISASAGPSQITWTVSQMTQGWH